MTQMFGVREEEGEERGETVREAHLPTQLFLREPLRGTHVDQIFMDFNALIC